GRTSLTPVQTGCTLDFNQTVDRVVCTHTPQTGAFASYVTSPTTTCPGYCPGFRLQSTCALLPFAASPTKMPIRDCSAPSWRLVFDESKEQEKWVCDSGIDVPRNRPKPFWTLRTRNACAGSVIMQCWRSCSVADYADPNSST